MNVKAMPDDQIVNMSTEALGLLILRHVRENNEWNVHNLLLHLSEHSETRGRSRSTSAQRSIAESANWLFNAGLLSRNRPPALSSGTGADSMFLTRAGEKVLSDVRKGLHSVAASQLLGDRLLPYLWDARSRFSEGLYTSAVLESMRTLETRVRQLAGPQMGDYSGVALMNHAFGKKGLLTDPNENTGRSDGIRSLFAGAFGMFRNHAAHGLEDDVFEHPAEVAEIILLSNLLHRHLDRVEKRVAGGQGSEPA